jgi:hypothetical protein
MTEIRFDAPPTVAAFMKSEAFMRVIAGPVGSGKTTGCLFELFRRACEQAPGPDGFRHTRFAILRQTLSQLKMTVLKDITTWLEGIAKFKVSENTIYIEIGDVKSEWVLIPLEDAEDQRRLLSSQLTGAWISECIEIDVDLVPAIAGRCGRYPSALHGGATWFGLIADTNMPTIGSQWHRLMEQDIPADWDVLIQPGGLEANAENLEWLTQTPETLKLRLDVPDELEKRRAQGRTYYLRLARSHGADWVKRYVHAQFGDDPSGTAVFRESFKQSFHVVDGVQPVNGHPLIVGLDFGRDPCAIVTQIDHKGRWLILEEIMAEDIGLEQQLRQTLKPALLQERYIGRPVAIVGDPAGRQRSTLYEETSFDLIKRAGLMAYPAPTNDIDARLRAVEAYLLAQRDGGPAMLIDRDRCPTLIRALSGGYRYGKTRAGMRKPTPDKNQYSHIVDALQYAAVAAHGGMSGMIAAKLQAPRRQVARVAAGGWT